MKKRWTGWLIVLAMVMGLLLTGCGAKSLSAVEARSGVVRVLKLLDVAAYDIDTLDYVKSVGSAYAMGSAFGVGSQGKETDVFVSNRHVVEDSVELGYDEEDDSFYLYQYTVTGLYILQDNFAYNTETNELDSSRAIPCTVSYVGANEAEDLAILRTPEPVPGRVALALQDSEDSLKQSDPVSALGYPYLSDVGTSEGYLLASVDDVTVTDGTAARFFDSVSVSSEETLGRVIQHRADINSGNCRGPLIDANGAVVGINTWVTSDGDQFTTTAYYALRIQYAKNALDSLGIAYDVYRPGIPVWLIVILAAAVVAVVVVVVVLLMARKKKPRPNAETEEYRIQCVSGVFAGRRFEIGHQLRMGRDPNRNDLVFPAQTQGVSGVHCMLILDGGNLYLQDLGSSYGTWLSGGRKLAPNQPVQLHRGDTFSLGSERESFVITGKGGL